MDALGLNLLEPPIPRGLTTAPEAEDCAEQRYPCPTLWRASGAIPEPSGGIYGTSTVNVRKRVHLAPFRSVSLAEVCASCPVKGGDV